MMMENWCYVGLCVLGVLVTQGLGHVEIVEPTTNYLTINSGNTLNVKCLFLETSHVSWLHNGVAVNVPSEKYSISSEQSDTSVLTIKDVTLTDSGQITCRDSNDHSSSDDITITIPVVEIVEPNTAHVSVSPGGSFMFKCVNKQGNMINWQHNGLPMQISTKVVITSALRLEGDRTSLFTRRGVKASDAGTYTCKEDGNPENSDTVEVTVEEPYQGDAKVDIVEPSLSHTTLKAGTPLHLTCTGSHNTDIGWLRDNRNVYTDSDGYIITESIDGDYKTSLLSRDHIFEEDVTYTCYNRDDRNDKDEIRVSYGGSDPVINNVPIQRQSLVIQMQSSISLQCQMMIDDDIQYDVEWTRFDQIIHPGEKYLISRSTSPSILTIRNTDENDIGQYKCTFVDAMTRQPVGEIIHSLSGTPCPPLEVPNNGTPLDCPQNAYVGDTCTILCDVRSPALVGSIVVMCARDEYTGDGYWSNTEAKCTAPIPPETEENIPSSLSHVLLRAGEPLRLQCGRSGVWARDKVRLHTGNKYHIINGTLVIKNTGKSDAAVYTCTLHDKGKVFGRKKFNVTYMACDPLSVPDAVMSGCSDIPVYGETCSFQCIEDFQIYGSPSTTCELTRSQTQTYWTSGAPSCSSNGLQDEFNDPIPSCSICLSKLSIIKLVIIYVIVKLQT